MTDSIKYRKLSRPDCQKHRFGNSTHQPNIAHVMRSLIEKPVSFSYCTAILLLSLLVGSCRSEHNAGSVHAERPNIVLIMADDLGYSDIGAYGGEIDTPHLNQLTAEGIQFTQFYNNAKCTESRAALLSGLYHHQSDNFKIPNHVTLAEVLKAAGYSTMMSGKWHLPGSPIERGFDRYFGFLVGAVNFFTGMHWGAGRGHKGQLGICV